MAASIRRNVFKTAQFFKNCVFCGRTSSAFMRQRWFSNEHAQQDTTHFGYETVTEEEKTEKVYKVFENVATSYDLMNDAMSFGIHRIWKDKFMKVLNPPPGTQLLDVAGGTGDIAFRFLKYVNRQRSRTYQPSKERESWVTVCDINKYMLEVGKQKANKLNFTSGLSWVAGDAQNLPAKDNSFDAYTIAFGIRNVTRIQEALEEAYRVLRPGGRFLCLEFSEVKNPVISRVYDKYSFNAIPVMGQVLAADWKSYQYLVESIRQFPNQEEFAGMIEDAGFRSVTYENLNIGVAAIHSGFKL
ncbi:2-methoxy-6-polyprenyl-1,4-benzoquinol methylase, mitochondrial-like [Actinia tenebrosa]|uniref:2-methoxy-6-polyprenyl-1,4-benzoquinol methylase, mitochondrial n=1 Tax=Actinia tenebrosa TaxID=6105 RepID=A0A6P8HD25_ACTTE|nr:2-methoxy-6-polyprenyl-1,4-benzoquinol methylase, mitochondrial-like [Actinia tenebrosa]